LLRLQTSRARAALYSRELFAYLAGMFEPFSDDPRARRRLASALRRLRQHSGLTSAEVARRMGMRPRTYQHFEAGGRITLARLKGFAAATDTDAMALVLEIILKSEGFALRCAGNKLASAVLFEIERLDQQLGEALPSLTTATVLLRVGEGFAALAADAAPGLSTAPRAPSPEPDSDPIELTERQLECLSWARAGKSSVDIGAILQLSRRTVDEHIADACRRFGVRTRVQAISAAVALGLLPPT